MSDKERLVEELRNEMANHYLGDYGDIKRIAKLKTYFWQKYGWDELKKNWNMILMEIYEFQKEEGDAGVL